MNTNSVPKQDDVFKRFLLLYGLFMLVSNAAYLHAYHFLPEGFLRGSAVQAPGEVSATGTFWSEMALTFLLNFGLVLLMSVSFNVVQIKGIPIGYFPLICLALVSGMTAGSNSFGLSDLKQFNVWEGTAINLGIGGLEFLGYILIVAATASIVVYYFSSWTQLKPTKLKNFRDIRLSKGEVVCLISGIVLLLVAAYRETVVAIGA